MHLIDRAAGALIRASRRRSAIFPDGWGDPARLSLFTQLPRASDPIDRVTIDWTSTEPASGAVILTGHFRSPIADLLPPAIADVHVEMISPPDRAGMCLLMPSWNDHDFEQRRKLAQLLSRQNLGAVTFDIPLYGRRRLTAAPHQAIRTVADFALMGLGAVVEARSLIAALPETDLVGVSGYSMGGNLAALVSATLPFPVATAALAASHSPGPVYLDGVLRNGIAWSSLGGVGQRERLRSILGSVSVLAYPPLHHHRHAVIVAATRDGFVPAAATRDLARHWVGSDLRWVEAGHATLLWRHRSTLTEAIVDAFVRLQTPEATIT